MCLESAQRPVYLHIALRPPNKVRGQVPCLGADFEAVSNSALRCIGCVLARMGAAQPGGGRGRGAQAAQLGGGAGGVASTCAPV
eukprot:2371859-Rhodomonas_salina.1